MALFLHPNLSVGLFRLEPIQTPGVSDLSQMLLLHRENFDTTQLGHWLITSRVDSPGSGSCLLNSKFSILTISKRLGEHIQSLRLLLCIWINLGPFKELHQSGERCTCTRGKSRPRTSCHPPACGPGRQRNESDRATSYRPRWQPQLLCDCSVNLRG